MVQDTPQRGYEIVDFTEIEGVACPCGTARRAFAHVEDFPGTFHVTEISADAKLHYHKRLTETYFFWSAAPMPRCSWIMKSSTFIPACAL